MGTTWPLYRLTAACVLALAGLAHAQPSGDAYIVLLRDTATGDVTRLAELLTRRHGGAVDHVYREGFRGFSARLSALSASGMRRDALVADLEPLLVPAPAVEEPAAAPPVKTPARTATVAVERLPFAPGGAPKLRRVLTPAADRYLVVLADNVPVAEGGRVADRLVREYGGERGPVEGEAFRVSMSESAARKMSRDPSVAYVEEQSIAEPVDPVRARRASRTLPGQGLRRVDQPVGDRYRLVLRASVSDDQVDATVSELLRAYEGRRHPGRSDEPRVIFVEMSEPSARALSDDFRVEYVEEQAASRSAGTR
jgi:hypothetical protein